jgi:hypothetical protein
LHQYIVLQPQDYQLLLEHSGTRNSPFNGLELDKQKETRHTPFVRSRSGEFLELNKCVLVSHFVELYGSYVVVTDAETIKLGPTKPVQSASKKNTSDRYRIKGMVSM